MKKSKEKLERIERLLAKLTKGKPEPIHFVPNKLPTTINEALELFQKHNPEWWDDGSLKWYKDHIKSELIDGNKFVIDATIIDGEHRYMVGMFDETFENMTGQVDKKGANIFYKTVDEALEGIKQKHKWRY